jgi:hypothetical protein
MSGANKPVLHIGKSIEWSLNVLTGAINRTRRALHQREDLYKCIQCILLFYVGCYDLISDEGGLPPSYDRKCGWNCKNNQAYRARDKATDLRECIHNVHCAFDPFIFLKNHL